MNAPVPDWDYDERENRAIQVPETFPTGEWEIDDHAAPADTLTKVPERVRVPSRDPPNFPAK